MTEVANLVPSSHRLASVRHYEAGPPEGLVEPGETFATTKEEEWVSKKKTEVLNTKQIETRVKRQVVLEDGKVVEDSGPMVSTNTTEDTETQEHHQTELRKLGDDEVDGKPALEAGKSDGLKKDWVAVPNPEGVVREVKERRVISREETEEVKEIEDVQHLGDITDEEFLTAVQSGRPDLRPVLRGREGSRPVVSTGPRVVHESSKSQKVTDTEDTRELSSVRPDGKIVTETERTTQHEEVKDDELPEGAEVRDEYRESGERYLKTREQEDVEYLADGVKVGQEMRYRTETMEAERRGEPQEDAEWDSLSARARRRAGNRPPHRYRGLDNESPLDRKDVVTKKPLDFDQEEETRKSETSKWLENHFGSESRSSNNSDIGNEEPPKTTFFNVTIKSQPKPEFINNKSFLPTVNNNTSTTTTTTATTNHNHLRVVPPVEPERDNRNHHNGYYKGISEWSERRQEQHQVLDRHSPPSPTRFTPERKTPPERFTPERRSPPERFTSDRRTPPERFTSDRRSPPDRFTQERKTPPEKYDRWSPVRQRSPAPDYRSPPRFNGVANGGYEVQKSNRIERFKVLETQTAIRRSPELDPRPRSPLRGPSPAPPQRKRTPQRAVNEERSRSRNTPPVQEPPPDYPPSPPSPPPMPMQDKKAMQKTRFQEQAPKEKKSGNIIGQSIRKLVHKIRSASAERRARQRAKRSPSPSYQQGHVIDGNIPHEMHRPVQRYYLGEDPFAGSIYGRENKYDGAKPRRRGKDEQDGSRSQSTLGRFSKSTSRLVNGSVEDPRNTQTLPRHIKHETPTRLENNHRSNSQINVSIINSVTTPRPKNEGPAKPARTYKSNLSRSKSFNAQDDNLAESEMFTKSTHHRLEKNSSSNSNSNSIGLKSPGLISSLNRSNRDIHEKVTRNGYSSDSPDQKKGILSKVKEKSPDFYQNYNENGDSTWKSHSIYANKNRNYNNGDIFEPPTRLRDSHLVTVNHPPVIRKGSHSSTDYSETYHTTTRNEDPFRPTVTDTVKSFTKKTIPSKDGRSVETVESTETKSVTKSHFRDSASPKVTYYEPDRRYNTGNSPVIIEVRNYRK